MRSSRTLRCLAGAGLSTAFLLSGCDADYLTGQLAEPKGPIQVLKLTLFDSTSRDAAVFTDMSLPDCSKAPDCSLMDNRDLRVCHICYNDVFKDTYGPLKSPPTTDSGQDIRVVFNKAPLLLDGKELGNDYDPSKDAMTSDASKAALGSSVKVTCSECGGVPAMARALFISGSDVSFDPMSIPYGPSIKLSVDTSDPRAALEPDSSYVVQLDNRISGRDGERWAGTADELALLKFKTEPFRILRAYGSSSSDAKDEWVYKSSAGSTVYDIADLPRNGAVSVRFNAPLFVGGLAGVAVDAVKNGSTPIAVKLGSDTFVNPGCKPKSQHELYVFPATGDWPADANDLKIRIPAGAIKDAAQGGTYAAGRHSIGSEIVLNVKFAATGGTAHIKNDDARLATQCP